MPRAKRGADAAGDAPTAPVLREAAMLYLSRFAATRASLSRVLERRIARWARAAGADGVEADDVRVWHDLALIQAKHVVAELVRAGAVDDLGFAHSRARSLTRTGRSARALAAHLAARGVDGETIGAAVQSVPASAQLAAALVQARRRRLGPFASLAPSVHRTGGQETDGQETDGQETDGRAAARRRGLAILARAGFSQDVAAMALDTDQETAETLIAELRASL